MLANGAWKRVYWLCHDGGTLQQSTDLERQTTLPFDVCIRHPLQRRHTIPNDAAFHGPGNSAHARQGLAYVPDLTNNMASLPCKMLLKWADWTQPENMPGALITAYKNVYVALSRTSRAISQHRREVDLGLERL